MRTRDETRHSQRKQIQSGVGWGGGGALVTAEIIEGGEG